MTQTSLRSATVARLVEALKRRQQLSLDKATPFFYQVGNSFTIGDDAWSGPAIATRDAIYLLKETKTRDALPMPGVASETNMFLCPQELLTLEYTELPSAITTDPHWEQIAKKQCPVTVLLREETTTTALVPFTSDIEFLSAYPLIRVRCGTIAPGDAEAVLRGSGWLPPRVIHDVEPVVQKTHWTPLIVGLCILAFVALTIAIVQSESLSVLASLALCLPLLGGLLAFLAWYLRPAKLADGPQR